MNIVTDIKEWQAIRKTLQGKTIGLVTTMGHLHAGHMRLCERAASENDVVVVSIFVNPTQFNQAQDFEAYARTLEADTALLAKHNVDYVLVPTPEAMYADGYEVQVTETVLSLQLEGEHRSGHFTGVLTVVLKLLNLVQATRAYFGKKDYQQLLLIQKMVKALFLPIEIVGCETVRADDALALSSRNARLNAAQREQAAILPKILYESATPEQATERLIEAGFTVDYVADQWGRRLAAVWLGNVRLIDNVEIKI